LALLFYIERMAKIENSGDQPFIAHDADYFRARAAEARAAARTKERAESADVAADLALAYAALARRRATGVDALTDLEAESA
jgi:hypothetical protein